MIASMAHNTNTDKDPDLDNAYALQSPDDNLALYRTWAETYDADFVEGTAYRLPELIANAYGEQGCTWPCLDVGCGTGAAAHMLPGDAVIDGLDLSPDMLAVAKRTGRYRNLIEANLKELLPLDDASFAGLISSGTFTHGHVGAEALDELIRILAPGAVAAISIRDTVWDSQNFASTFARLQSAEKITPAIRTAERIYRSGETAPEGHAEDVAYITTFQRL